MIGFQQINFIVWIFLIILCFNFDFSFSQTCKSLDVTERKCLVDGPFEFNCDSTSDEIIYISSARILITKETTKCFTTFNDVCEVANVTNHTNVQNCTRSSCTISNVHQSDVTSCAGQGYNGSQIIEVTYRCNPIFGKSSKSKAMTFDNSDTEWKGTLLQVDSHKYGLGLLVANQTTTVPESLINNLAIKSSDQSCHVTIAPNTEVYLKLQAFGLFPIGSYVATPCAQRIAVWDGPDNKIVEYCAGDKHVVKLPCIDKPRILEVYLINEEPTDVRLVSALHVGVSHAATQMSAQCNQPKIVYTTAAIPTTELPTTESLTTEPPTTKLPTTVPSTTQPPTTQPSTTKPSTTQLSTTQPSTTQPSTTQPSTTQPSTTQPSTQSPTTKPSTTQPSTTQPSTQSPTTEPSTTKSQTTKLPTTQPPTTQRPTTQPSTTQPSTVSSNPAQTDKQSTIKSTTNQTSDANFKPLTTTSSDSGGFKNNDGSNSDMILIIIVVCCGVSILLLMLAVFIVLLRKRHYQTSGNKGDDNRSTTSSENLRHVTEVYVEGDMKSRLFTPTRGGFSTTTVTLGGYKGGNLHG